MQMSHNSQNTQEGRDIFYRANDLKICQNKLSGVFIKFIKYQIMKKYNRIGYISKILWSLLVWCVSSYYNGSGFVYYDCRFLNIHW